MTTDASGYCGCGVISQLHSGCDHPIALFPKTTGFMVFIGRHMKKLFLQEILHWKISVITVMLIDLTPAQRILHAKDFCIVRTLSKAGSILDGLSQSLLQLPHVQGPLNVAGASLSRQNSELSTLLESVQQCAVHDSASSSSRFHTLEREDTTSDSDVDDNGDIHDKLSTSLSISATEPSPVADHVAQESHNLS